jgi:hypothetical protein
MECKFNIYVRLLYTKWCGTWIPIHVSGNKKRKIDEIIFEEEKQPSHYRKEFIKYQKKKPPSEIQED